jgi:hypothetical protein
MKQKEKHPKKHKKIITKEIHSKKQPKKKKGEKTKRDTPGKKHKTTKSSKRVSRYPKNEKKIELKK